MRSLVALASGVLFGAGLCLAGMTNPQKVLNFLDVSGAWDPSLAFVMGGALVVAAVAHQIARRRPAPLLAPRFALPARAEIDRDLLLGATLFGVGWGLVGYCPGPALANLAHPTTANLVFVASMLVGIVAFRLLGARRAAEGALAGVALLALLVSPEPSAASPERDDLAAPAPSRSP